MLLFTFVLLLVLTVANSEKNGCQTPVIVGPVQLQGGGEQLYVTQKGGMWYKGIKINGTLIWIPHNHRIYLSTSCAQGFSPNMYKQFYLLGRSIAFSVDVSRVGCGCDASAYLISMPGYGSNQRPFPAAQGDYYCDANKVDGNYCPEIDLMEANKYNFHITPHKCDPKSGRHYNHCDGGGCSRSLYSMNPKSYGPGAQYTIDTRSWFRVNITFGVDGSGNLNSVTTDFWQPPSKRLSVVHDNSVCGGGYLASLTAALKGGMVLAVSNWGTDGGSMTWLDVPPCSRGVKCNNGQFNINDIQYT